MTDRNPWRYDELVAWRRRWALLAWGTAAMVAVLGALRLTGILWPTPGSGLIFAMLGAIPLVSAACWAHFARLAADHPDRTDER